jgi:hypothetical protein
MSAHMVERDSHTVRDIDARTAARLAVAPYQNT